MIYVFLADGFEEMEAITPVDLLRRAQKEVRTVGVGSRTVTGSHGIPVVADITAEELSEEDLGRMEMLVLPGGMPGAVNLKACPAVQKAVAFAHAHGRYIGAICAAPGVVLSGTGVLDGRRWTCFSGFETVEGHFTGAPVERDGALITANGPASAWRFGQMLAEALAKG